MLVTSIPAFALVSSASTTPSNNSAKYLMAYFTGNGNVTSSGKQQAIHFAVSDDGSNYTALNGKAPAILQTTGTHNARDPYIFRGHDGDYSNGDWGKAQSTMTVWHSSDLTHWDSETHIDISQISGYTFSNYCWAPQVIWDDNVDEYMIYFATSDGSKQTIHYIYTTDLLDFSKYEVPKQLVDFNYNGTSYASIDADITYYNGKYIMFFKDESDYNASTNPGGKKLAFSVALLITKHSRVLSSMLWLTVLILSLLIISVIAVISISMISLSRSLIILFQLMMLLITVILLNCLH